MSAPENGQNSSGQESINYDDSSATSTVDEDNDVANLTITAESLGNGQVKVTWEAPQNLSPGATIRLMHSGSEHPSFPPTGKFNPFWQQVTSGQHEYTFTNVSAGTRYFRACEFINSCVGNCEFPNGRCENYSNEVTVDVK